MRRPLHLRFSLIALVSAALVACTGGSAPAPTPVPPRSSSPVTLLTATPLPRADRPLAGGGAALPRPTLPPVAGGALPTVSIPQVNTTPPVPAPLPPIATSAPSSASGPFALPTSSGLLRPVQTFGPASVAVEVVLNRPTPAPAAPLQIPTFVVAPQPTPAPKPTAPQQTIQFPGSGGGGAGGGGAGGGGGGGP